MHILLTVFIALVFWLFLRGIYRTYQKKVASYPVNYCPHCGRNLYEHNPVGDKIFATRTPKR